MIVGIFELKDNVLKCEELENVKKEELHKYIYYDIFDFITEVLSDRKFSYEELMLELNAILFLKDITDKIANENHEVSLKGYVVDVSVKFQLLYEEYYSVKLDPEYKLTYYNWFIVLAALIGKFMNEKERECLFKQVDDLFLKIIEIIDKTRERYQSYS